MITNKTDGPTADALLSFNDDDVDVLLLKNIGRVGFDCPRLKVLGDFSTIRSEGKVAQTWLRVSTPYDNIPGVIITPGDPTACDLFEKIVTHNGGDRMSRTGETEVRERKEVTVERTTRELTVGNVVPLPIKQNDMKVVAPEDDQLVKSYLAEFPGYSDVLQRLDLARRVTFVREQQRDFNWQPKEPCAQTPQQSEIAFPPVSRPTEPHRYRPIINDLLDEATHRAIGCRSMYELSEEDKKAWKKKRSELLKSAKRRAGQPEDRALEQIQNIEALQIIEDYLRDRAR
jgi:hypothetical protein